jgi:hypothetical protein
MCLLSTSISGEGLFGSDTNVLTLTKLKNLRIEERIRRRKEIEGEVKERKRVETAMAEFLFFHYRPHKFLIL